MSAAADAFDGVIEQAELLLEAVADEQTQKLAEDLVQMVRDRHIKGGLSDMQVLSAVGILAGGTAAVICSALPNPKGAAKAAVRYVATVADFQEYRVRKILAADKEAKP